MPWNRRSRPPEYDLSRGEFRKPPPRIPRHRPQGQRRFVGGLKAHRDSNGPTSGLGLDRDSDFLPIRYFTVQLSRRRPRPLRAGHRRPSEGAPAASSPRRREPGPDARGGAAHLERGTSLEPNTTLRRSTRPRAARRQRRVVAQYPAGNNCLAANDHQFQPVRSSDNLTLGPRFPERPAPSSAVAPFECDAAAGITQMTTRRRANR